MITTCEKNTNGKNSTAVNRSAKKSNGAPARKASKPSNQPIARTSAPDLSGREPRPLPPVSEFGAEDNARREAGDPSLPEANSGLQQNNAAAITRLPRLDVSRLEQMAVQLGQALGGNVAATALPISNPQRGEKPVAKVSANAPPQVTAEYLHRAGVSSFFFSAAKKIFRDQISAQTIQDYIEELVVCCEANHDPLEFFLVEQIALLRFTGALLHGVTVNSEDAQNRVLLNSAGCQTNGEMRRAIMTLRDYRKDNGLSRSKPSDKTVKSESSSAEKLQQK